MTLLIIILLFIFYLKNKAYLDTDYYKESGNSYLSTKTDAGVRGEYLIFNKLNMMYFEKKILTNVYLPKSDGGTTEVDVIMICKKGFFVFESKNYSGWIFGDEKRKMWTQSLKNRQKNKFFNPIWQNRLHIKELKNAIDHQDDKLFFSYIIFSERCELKKITHSDDVKVIKRDDLKFTIRKHIEILDDKLSDVEINSYYTYLKKYSNANNELKEKHIESIKESR